MDINQPFSNFSCYLKNYTPNTFFGVTSSGKLFNLAPENPSSAMMSGTGGVTGIYVVSAIKTADFTSGFWPEVLDAKWYKSPMQGESQYISELNVVLYSTEDERYKMIEKYGDVGKLVKSYAASTLPLINASYIAITSLNKDKQYFSINDRSIVELPREEDSFISECEKRYGITEEMLQIYDIFIINNIYRASGKSKQVKDSIVSSDIRRIQKNSIKKGEPLIFANNGLVIFDSRDSAEAFLDKYTSVSQYMISTALDATHQIHDDEIEELNARAGKDKRGIVETFGIMGGTSVMSILTENVVKSAMNGESNSETAKKAGKIFIIGAIGVGSVFAVYKLYRAWEEKKEKDKKNSNGKTK